MRAISASCSSVQAANHGTPCRRGSGRLASVGFSRPSLAPSTPRARPRAVRVRASPSGRAGIRAPGSPEEPKVTGRGRFGRGGVGWLAFFQRGGQAGVDGAQPARHAPEQRVAEAGDVGHGGELARPDDQHVEVGQRGHRRVARSGVHGRQLAEEFARAQGVDPAALLGHRHRAGEDQEELPADAPLAGQDLALADLDPFGQARHLSQLFLAALVQFVDGPEAFDHGLSSQGHSHFAASLFRSRSGRARRCPSHLDRATVRPAPCNGVAPSLHWAVDSGLRCGARGHWL